MDFGQNFKSHQSFNKVKRHGEKEFKTGLDAFVKKKKFYWAKTDRYNTSNDVTDEV